MTGFGAGSAEMGGIQVSIEARSVNHRFLKVVAHFGQPMGQLQHELEERVRKRFGRGAITVQVRWGQAETGSEKLVDRARLRRLVSELTEFRQEMNDAGEALELERLALVPGVVRDDSERMDVDAVKPPFDQALEDALAALESMQQREGTHLGAVLTQVVAELGSELDRIESALPEIREANRDRYRNRIAELLQSVGVEVDDAIVLREVAVLAEKADVAEEISRLRGHLEQYQESLDGGGRIGRKLDFLTQEMFREANTMASKVNRYELSRTVVEMKTRVDRLREQTQNIE